MTNEQINVCDQEKERKSGRQIEDRDCDCDGDRERKVEGRVALPKEWIGFGKQAGKQASLGFRFFPRSSDYVLYVCR